MAPISAAAPMRPVAGSRLHSVAVLKSGLELALRLESVCELEGAWGFVGELVRGLPSESAFQSVAASALPMGLVALWVSA